jgi:1,4-dihydroxy-2-naphthoate octaprenyltransferase
MEGLRAFRLLAHIARPQFLIPGALLYTFGALLAVLSGAAFAWPQLLLGYAIVLPAQLSVSYSNDYYDAALDAQGTPTPFTGGSGVLVAHPELRQAARRIAVGLIFCSVTVAALFAVRYTMPVGFLGFVVACNLLGWFYTAPPLRLAYRGLGEPANAAMAGLLPLAGYLALGGQDARGLALLVVPLTLYGLAFIIGVSIPDMEVDRLGGKRTWVARRGRRWGFAAVGAALLGGTICVLLLHAFRGALYGLDARIMAALSLPPLIAGATGWLLRPTDRAAATRLVNAAMICLAAFNIAIVAYAFTVAASAAR